MAPPTKDQRAGSSGKRKGSVARVCSDEELAEYLGGRDIPLAAYLLVGEPGGDLPCVWLPEVGFRHIIIETAGLDHAATAFLARRGTRRFPDTTAVLAAAHVERWPGWEQRSPVAHE
ncbi:hypothetical protein [Zavarzinella formosa]|uniref:hypothetical protein n=1 Tax=Zavarzinella formosa TaxID=360055 RepID=UPI0002D949BA|nr:hypothetical protein [Zavarzinella formosa]